MLDGHEYVFALGLSPHTRGSRILTGLWTGLAGSIPAHAGEPPQARRSLPEEGVYPRTRGGAARS